MISGFGSMLVFGGNKISKRGGSTPTIVAGPPPRSTDLPMTLASPPNRRFQYASVRITMVGSGGVDGAATGAAPGGGGGGAGGANASSSEKSRPKTTRAPSSARRFGVTDSPR